jgi:hypothetical protein
MADPVIVGANIVTWPEGVARVTGVSEVTLNRQRMRGDAPRLYAVAERRLVTTQRDLEAWIASKAVPHDYRCRPPTHTARAALADAGGDE